MYAAFAWGQDGFIKGSPELAYWKIGNKKEVVIVLHGGPSAAHNYLRPEWDQLSKAAQVVYYDQRGCGKSQKAACYSWREHVEDLKRVINAFSKGKRVILAGSSWGSMLAFLYAYTYPDDVKAMILSGTVTWRGQNMTTRDCSVYKPSNINPERDNDSTTFMSFIRYRTYSDTSSYTDLNKTLEVHSFNRRFTEASLIDAPKLNDLRKIQEPVLIFQGTGNCTGHQDAAKQFIGMLSNLEVYPIKDACHDPWYTHTEEFFKKCNEFIKKVRHS
ncbi:alpha/beta hydrolase [Chitinophagaceae bacterium LB-8]|uniref:Alpha/beta hydrolase n=2 Tax=Paraflavisolibacter caeni TaxID=2982496 RepID=A0A9X2XYV0_9BACT|nr:alpha/beta hydrolase [Paraflavisolibacter caeni]